MLCSYCLASVLTSRYYFASLSSPTVFLQCYSLLLLYFGQINDDDDDDDDDDDNNDDDDKTWIIC